MQMVRFYERRAGLHRYLLPRRRMGPGVAAHHPEDAVGSLLHLCHLRASRQHPDLGRAEGRGCRRQHHPAAAAGNRHHAAGLSRRSAAAGDAASGWRRVQQLARLGHPHRRPDDLSAAAGRELLRRTGQASFSIATRIPALPTRPCSRLRETFASTGATSRFPSYVIAANKQAHAAITDYLQANKIASAPWLAYKLVNVQYYPYDKIPDPNIPDGSPYTSTTAIHGVRIRLRRATIRQTSSSRPIVPFSSLPVACRSAAVAVSTQWNADGSLHKNTYYGGHFYNMGGCMGCHGSQGQNPAGQAGDFSVILARGGATNAQPETPAMPSSQGMSTVKRNRTLR